MLPELVFGLSFLVLLLLIATRVPIGLALGTSGAIGLYILHDGKYLNGTLGTTPYESLASYSLVLIPMFMLMGILLVSARISTDVFAFANTILRGVPGGLAYATLGASAGFAAVTGSSVATVVTIGKVAIADMRRVGYPSAFTGALIASAGTLGILIPPSLLLVMYGIVTQESIGALLLAALIPGLLSVFAYAVVIWVWTVRNKATIASIKASANEGQRAGAGEDSSVLVGTTTWKGVVGLLQILLIMVTILGGIYAGVFTPTESGAIAAAVCLVVMLAVNFRTGLLGLFRLTAEALREGSTMTSMIALLLVGGGVFMALLVSTGIPTSLAGWVAEVDVPPVLIIALIILILVPLGMFLDGYTILLLTAPLFHPVVTSIGFDGVWFGIVMVIMIEVSVITPPVGLNVFAVAGIDDSVNVERVFREVLPFIGSMFVIILLLIVFPDLALWLPSSQSGD